MVQSVLAEEEPTPSPEEFRRAVGRASPLWSDMARWLTADVGAQGAARWGGPKYGWEMSYRRAGRPFTSLTPLQDRFVALVILGRADAEEAASLPLGPRTRRAFDDTSQLLDGRWLFLEVATTRDLADAKALLGVKLPRRLRTSLAGARWAG